MLWSCLSLLGAACSSVRGASKALSDQYLDLKSAVTLPLRSITHRWHALAFEAWIPPTRQTASDKLLKGILLRTSEGDSGDLKAFCLLCPHEICEVQYQTETGTVRLESGTVPDHPLLVCPCHFSVFDPMRDGEVINGPAQRGLYRFRLSTRGSNVQITHVEEQVLTLFT
jgi:nitrite reductase/ring-hydroxylating ferredoxin subunit|tara:strand:+ start:1275 stop:1784 length:510 start_codon:yes stop_codon:yes gene_type:complete